MGKSVSCGVAWFGFGELMFLVVFEVVCCEESGCLVLGKRGLRKVHCSATENSRYIRRLMAQ